MFGDPELSRNMSPTVQNAAMSRLLERVKDLDEQVARLRLFNQALWELLCERGGMDRAELEQRICEIDGRDGKVDGRMSEMPLKCPQCNRISNSRRGKCIYCNLEFERDTVV